MKAKNVVLVLAAAGLISTQAYAADAGTRSGIDGQGQAAFTEADTSSMFEQSGKPMQVASLSSQEMKSTEGAAVPWVLAHAGGAIAGMYGAGYGYLAGGGRNPTEFRNAVVGGLVGGALSPVNGVRSAAMTLGGSALSSAYAAAAN